MQTDRQVIIVSGGSRGLGQSLVHDLLGRGHIVATFSRSQTPFITECLAREPGRVGYDLCFSHRASWRPPVPAPPSGPPPRAPAPQSRAAPSRDNDRTSARRGCSRA